MELGISSPLTQTGTCKPIKAWLIDTATIYRIGITRTGAAMALLGLGNVVIGATMITFNQRAAWPGMGVWTGILIMLSGFVCMVSRLRQRPLTVKLISYLNIFCLIGFVASLISLTTSIISLWYLSHSIATLYPHYANNTSLGILPLYIMNGVLVTVAPIQCFFSFWALSISIGYVWPCFSPIRAGIFTIMVEEDIYDRTLASEQDTEMTAFTGQNLNHYSSLQIQTDWIEDNKNNNGVTR